jgi:hypothetical protein
MWIQMYEVVLLEADKVEGVAGPAADPAEAGGQAEQGAQAGRVRRVHRLSAQPHRHKNHHRFPPGVSGQRRPG